MKRIRRAQPFNTLILGLICAYFAMPLWWLAVSSTKTQGELVQDAGFLSFSTHFIENVQVLFARNGGRYGQWLLNSVLYAGVLVPPAALALPLFLMFSELGLTNSLWSVFLPSLVSPLGVYLARVSVDASVPSELIEAASIDGAGGLRIFFKIALPLMGPGLVTIYLFQFVGIWNNFLLPLIMLNDTSLYPVTLGLYNWSGQYIQDPTLATSVLVGSLVSSVPVIIGFVLLQRFWNTGLTQGAVKS